MSIDPTFDKTIPSVGENDDIDDDDDEMVIMVYQALAKQMEYYFSYQNLMVDTYLQTLRELNDGCVPISILANFSKIKTIVAPLLLLLQKHHDTKKLSIMSSTTTTTSTSSTSSTNDVVSDVPSNNNTASSLSSKAHRMLEEEQRRIDIVLHVMQQEYCDHLQVYTIDSQTGKMISNHQNKNTSSDASSSASSSNSTTTILAIGFEPGCSMEHVTPVKNETIHNTDNNNNNNADNIDTSTSVSSLDETNTLILRDVDPQVSEHEIHSIFDMICDCPTIAKIVPDIAACWFITFATTDRYDLIRVMMQLRTMTYPSNGDPIMVRLRASVVPSQSTIIRVDSYDYHHHHHHHHHSNMASTIHNMGDPCIAPKKKRRKKKRSKNKKNKTTSTTSVASTTSLATSDASVTDTTTTTNKEPSLLHLSHDDFPSLLQHNTDKVEWSTSSIDMVSRSINDDIEDEVSQESSTNKEDECFEEDEEEVEDNGLEMKLTSKLRLNHSDTASTATTTSSNASSGSYTVKSPPYHGEKNGASPAVLSGYAAAVRRVVSSSMDGPVSSVPVQSRGCMEVEVSSASTRDGKNGCYSELSSSTPSITYLPHHSEDHHTDHCVFTEPEPAAMKIPPIKWGTRRSFVDVIRESSSHNSSIKQ